MSFLISFLCRLGPGAATLGEILLAQRRHAPSQPCVQRVELLQPRASLRRLILEGIQAQTQHLPGAFELLGTPEELVPGLRLRQEAVEALAAQADPLDEAHP